MKMISNKKSKGFSLIEVLIAISILLVGVLSAFALVSRSLASVPVIQDRLVASFLAQEKLEGVRKVRDSNFLKILHDIEVDDWASGIVDQEDNFDLNNVTFTRKIVVTPIDPDVHLKVECTVSWKTRGHPYSFTAEDHLFNWINI